VRYNENGPAEDDARRQEASDQVWLGDRSRTIGYDVDWKYRDKSGTFAWTSRPASACRSRMARS
jgi:hypothetical protein